MPATDEHLWANTYDRRLSTDNLFAIQTEIATTIADKLKATLTPDEKERITKVPTENLQAYNLYLAGRQNLYQRKVENLQRARELFEQAIALDPKFAKAYSGLSDTLIILYSNFGALEPDVVIPKSQGPARQGARARPGRRRHPRLARPPGQHPLGRDVSQPPISPRPSRPSSARSRSTRTMPRPSPGTRGRSCSAASTPTRSSSSSARCSSTRWRASRRLNLGESYAGIGEHRKALDIWLESARTNPDWPTAPEDIGLHLADLGRLDEALAWAARGPCVERRPFDRCGVRPASMGRLARRNGLRNWRGTFHATILSGR